MGFTTSRLSSTDQSRFSSFFFVHNRSVDRLEEAEILLLPEKHTSEKHHVLNGWLISKFYRPGDIILIEGAERGLLVQNKPVITILLENHSKQAGHNQAKFVPGNPIVQGWDSMRAHAQVKEAKKIAFNAFQEIEKIYKELKLRKNPQSAFRKLQNVYQKAFQRDLSFSSKQQAYSVSHQILGHYLNFVGKPVAETFTERNISLIQSIEEHYNQKKRIFLIAGANHLFNNPRHQKAVDLLNNYLVNKKFLLLNHKVSSPSHKLIKRELVISKAGGRLKFMLNKIAALILRIAFILSLPITIPLHLLSRKNYENLPQLYELAHQINKLQRALLVSETKERQREW